MKAVLFDFDGTIAETLKLTIQLFNEVAPKYKLPTIKADDLPRLRDLSAKELLKMFPLPPLKVIQLTREIQHKQKESIGQVELIQGMEKVLAFLKKRGIEVGIVTSNSEENVTLFLQRHQITSVRFVASEKSLFGKDKVLKKVLKKRRWLATETIYVGDEVRDIEAAHKAGLRVAAVSWGFNSPKRLQAAQPDSLSTTPEELLKSLTNKL